MIIWLDGAYGVGKTSIANEIKDILCDDEVIFIDSDDIWDKYCNKNIDMIIKDGGMIPQNNKAFLKYFGTYVEKYLLSSQICIVAMALTEPESIELLWKKLCEKSGVLQHIVLLASKESILNRIANDKNRGDKALARFELDNNINFYLEEFNDAIKINTDNRSIKSISEEILLSIDLV